MKNKYSETAEVFKAFCDENRIRILEVLQTGEKCGCKLLEELNVTQPTLSHHMKILCDAGIVDSRKEGKWTHYKISNEGRSDIIKLLEEITKIDSSCVNKSCD
ncbi:MAG: metalloregulator ArsR/SmtB family transcription factor [Clostridiales bacterium]|nr:metalloregulator ArsR/SmtB family transcription factor [Clostridiales bacterium]